MINLEPTLYIDADKYQFILKESFTVEKGDRAGETDFRVLGYYPSISSLLHQLTERKIRDGIKRCASLRAIQVDLEEWAKGLKTPLVASLKAAVEDY